MDIDILFPQRILIHRPRALPYFQHAHTVYHLFLTAHLLTNNNMLYSPDKAAPVVLIILNNSCLFYAYVGWTNFLHPTSAMNTSKPSVQKLLSF